MTKYINTSQVRWKWRECPNGRRGGGHALIWNNLSLSESIHHEIYTFLSSEEKNRWEKTQTSSEQSPTGYWRNTTDRDSLTYQRHLITYKYPNTLVSAGSLRQRGCRMIYLSAQTAIYSTWLPPQPRGLTTTPARVKPSVEWHGVVPTPGERASTRWHQSQKGRRFRRQRGQMTRMPLGSAKGREAF